jgi:hypothetical protein
LSQTGHLRLKAIALLPPFLGLVRSTNKTTVITMAVPVKNSFLSQQAFSAIPVSAIQLATTRMLAVRKMVPINPNTIAFLIVEVITLSFQKSVYLPISSVAHICERARIFFKKNLLSDVSGALAQT